MQIIKQYNTTTKKNLSTSTTLRYKHNGPRLVEEHIVLKSQTPRLTPPVRRPLFLSPVRPRFWSAARRHLITTKWSIWITKSICSKSIAFCSSNFFSIAIFASFSISIGQLLGHFATNITAHDSSKKYAITFCCKNVWNWFLEYNLVRE